MAVSERWKPMCSPNGAPAKWVAGLISVLIIVATVAHKHAHAMGRIVQVENECRRLADLTSDIHKQLTDQGLLLARIAGRLGVEEK